MANGGWRTRGATNERGLRRGDVVEVLTADEILATLDEEGCHDGMPFMPEMIPFCGGRYTVEARTEKICDTLRLQSRRLADSVILDDLRCDGSGHDGCQSECRLYWNDAWLRKVDAGSTGRERGSADATAALLERVAAHTRRTTADGDVYRCQATEMMAASEPVSTVDPRPYVRELTSGNVSARKFIRVMSRAVVMQPLHKLDLLKMPPIKGTSPKTPESTPLDLQPGDWVRVKPREELEKMLTDKGTNRGLWFDREMLAFCGQTLQVRRRVTKIIDEHNGKMLELKRDCISLEHGVCSGERSTGRFFCPREIYSYYREAWLERVDPPPHEPAPRH